MMKYFLTIVILILSICIQDASAFWGSSDNETKSGLNVATGFDVNTITTLSGVVLDPPEDRTTQEPAVLSMTTKQGEVTVIIGPRWYWKQQNVILLKNQEITVTGSRAQGKDGSFYIFAQRIEDRSNGKTVTLRSENGVPLWSRAGSGNHGGMGRQNGNCQPVRPGNQGSSMRGGRH